MTLSGSVGVRGPPTTNLDSQARLSWPKTSMNHSIFTTGDSQTGKLGQIIHFRRTMRSRAVIRQELLKFSRRAMLLHQAVNVPVFGYYLNRQRGSICKLVLFKVPQMRHQWCSSGQWRNTPPYLWSRLTETSGPGKLVRRVS